MKRYLAFYGDHYYPLGGMDDFLSDHHTEEEAIETLSQALVDSNRHVSYKWAYVYDTETKDKVWEV